MTTTTETKRWTWERLTEIEPKLLDLEAEIRAIKPGRGFCANYVWYGYEHRPSLKHRLCALVGWSSDNAKLRGHEAYDLAYSYLYGLLPACRHDGPFC